MVTGTIWCSGTSSCVRLAAAPAIAGGAFDAVTVAPAALFAASGSAVSDATVATFAIADPFGAAQLKRGDDRHRLDAPGASVANVAVGLLAAAAAHAAAGRAARDQAERRRQLIA